MRGAVGDRGQMDQAVGRSADRLQHDLGVAERGPRQQFARARCLGQRHRGGDLAARFGEAKALGMRRRYGRAHRQRQAERFGDAGHRAGGAHHHAGADRGRETAVDGFDLDLVDFAGAELGPQPAAIGAGAQHFALVMPDHHRAHRNDDGRQVGADRGHDLRRQRLVAAADHDHRVHRLGADHLLGIHRHQVAQIHRGRKRKAFGDRDGRKHHRHRAVQHDAAFHRLDDLRHVAVTGVVVAVGVGDADNRTIQRIVGIAHRLDEGLAQEQRKPGIAVARQALAQSVSHLVLPFSRHSGAPERRTRNP